MEIVFLGTSAGIPTKSRNQSGVLVRLNGEHLLFDCGEGIQRQMVIAGVPPVRADRVFITHWHADHYMGLPSLMRTISLAAGHDKTLHVYGPGAPAYLKLLHALLGGETGRTVGMSVAEEKTIYETDSHRISTFQTKHSVDSVGYVIEEKVRWNIDMRKAKGLGLLPGPHLEELKAKGLLKTGKKTIRIEQIATKRPGRKIVYTGDTLPTEAVIEAAKGADILIHEATYLDEEVRKDRLHTLAHEAAEVAKKAGVKRLVITHISNRYEGEELLKAAKRVFKNTTLAKDFLRIAL